MRISGFLAVLQQLNFMVENPTGISGFASECIRIIAIVTFLLTFLQCFLGYKLFKFWVTVCGFFTFGIMGGVVSNTSSDNAGMAMFIVLLSALLGAFITFKLYKVGIFILCGFMGFLLGYVLTQVVTLGIIMALVLGVLSIFFVRPVIIVSTSLSGGLIAGISLAKVLDISSFATSIIIGILFAGFGMVVQFATNKKISNVNEDNSQNNTLIVSSMKSSCNFFTKEKNKIEIENLIIMEKASGLTLDEVSEDMEGALYSIKTLKYIMPFVEYILYFACFIVIIYPLFMASGLIDGNISLLLVIGILCFAKKKYNAIAIAFSFVTISKLVMIIRIIMIPSSFNNLPIVLIDTVITGFISFIALKYFFKSENVVNFKNRVVKLFNKQRIIQNKQRKKPHQENNVKEITYCWNCGEVNNITDNFCRNCGGRLSREIKQVTDKQAKEAAFINHSEK
ncbi:TM7S3/TM198-like domain-containing protein [Clostridium estertheticum]|uniref:TM7S3/TM198-like domain-containing protein n=1 Tax=Clostridium estertheticum subsp. estertheticum TaxID=1552 RepID=A0A1J0GM39_9CLOT|nr:DUF4203 domain-containing protein [Clostridium estertheticum]APC42008.1 hypothetical protein A7L45_19010 [Clostridium estertheticum subsp. estertheticum]MBU3075900.1 DUF4203 domain-containing protein [Clostridium estertheticum]MBU3165862.1 DUF4203 domain-containing protein [Clostridium estertheticum]MBU3172923.1 DUF4203 domain-containing protein [Clostridium estertheticum]